MIGQMMSRVTKARLEGASSREEVLAAFEEILANMIGSHQYAIFTLDGEGRELTLMHSDGIATWRYRRVPIGKGVIGRVAATGEPYIADGGDGHPDEPDLTACFPLELNGTVTGAIAIFRLLPQKAGFGDEDRKLLGLLGTQGAAALHRTVPRWEGV